MKVKNLNGTSKNSCKCISWLAHWERFSLNKANYCSEETCIEKATLGAHVQRADISDFSWYIIPLCSKHNKNVSDMNITDSTKLVSANVSKTCG